MRCAQQACAPPGKREQELRFWRGAESQLHSPHEREQHVVRSLETMPSRQIRGSVCVMQAEGEMGETSIGQQGQPDYP